MLQVEAIVRAECSYDFGKEGDPRKQLTIAFRFVSY